MFEINDVLDDDGPEMQEEYVRKEKDNLLKYKEDEKQKQNDDSDNAYELL